MSRPAPRPIGFALEALSGDLAPASTLGRVQEAWERAAGAQISAAATPASERDGVLTVRCESSVWAQELELMKDVLVERLNAELGEHAIRALRCRVA
jgi:predicted nucleic acid-binding Zn ribbon protein